MAAYAGPMRSAIERHGEAQLLLVDEAFAAPYLPGSSGVRLPAGCEILCTERGLAPVPAMILFLLQSPVAEQSDYNSPEVIAYGGSPIAESLLQQAMRTFKCDFVQVYGLTEVSGPGTFLNQEDHRLAASTRPELLRSA